MSDTTASGDTSATGSPPAPPLRRIAIVTETYPPEVNGVAQTIAKVVDGLREAGHDLTLIRPRQDKPSGESASKKFREVTVRGVPIPKYNQLKLGLPASLRLTRLWREHRPDLVHIVTEGPLGLSALVAARRLGIPVASEFRTNFHTYSAHYGIGWLRRPIMGYLRAFHNRTGCTMVATRALAEELAAEGFANLRVVARGVDTQRFQPARRCPQLRTAWQATPETLVVLYVGRIAEEKNLPLLFRAFAPIRAVRPNARLVLVGDGPARAALTRKYPDAIFAGVQRGEELARHYASADLFLFPSLTETFGNVTPEALASGLAVLAYDHAAARELILTGKNGVTVPPGEEAEFVRRAAEMATRPPLDLAQMREQARESVGRLSWPRIIGEIEQVYSHLRAARHTADATVAIPMLSREV